MPAAEAQLPFELEWEAVPLPELPLLQELCLWRDVLFRNGLIGLTADGIGYGNLSVRSGPGAQFFITGTGTGGLPHMSAEHCSEVLEVELHRPRIRCRGLVRPSSESLSHAALYLCSPAIGAVAHVHDAALWHRLRGKLPTATALGYGTPELAADIQRLVREHRLIPSGVIVMGGHQDGLLSFGQTLCEAVTLLLRLRSEQGVTEPEYSALRALPRAESRAPDPQDTVRQ